MTPIKQYELTQEQLALGWRRYWHGGNFERFGGIVLRQGRYYLTLHHWRGSELAPIKGLSGVKGINRAKRILRQWLEGRNDVRR